MISNNDQDTNPKSSVIEGIELDRIIIINAEKAEKTIKRLQCPICLNLLLNPVSCLKCQSNFCEPCIDSWIKTKGSAICVNRCSFTKGTTAPIIKDLLSDLEISCLLKKKGCQEVLNYDALIKHEEKCLYQNRACSGCGIVSIVKEIIEHEKGCDRALVTCNECGSTLNKQEIVVHEKDKIVCNEAKVENMRRKCEEEKRAEIERLQASKPVCNNKHLLQFYTDDRRNYPTESFTCKKCRTSSENSSFHCPQCKYDLCDKCYAFPFSRDKCMYNHGLVKKNKWDRPDSECDRCSGDQTRFWYYCNVCDFDLCESCHDLLQ